MNTQPLTDILRKRQLSIRHKASKRMVNLQIDDLTAGGAWAFEQSGLSLFIDNRELEQDWEITTPLTK